MTRPVKIDVIADVSCPWSAIGLAELRRALVLSSGLIDAEIVLRPYELNPWMPADGQNLMEYSAWMHGMDPAAFDRRCAVLRERAAEAGVDMAIDADSRIHYTFDAHRLLRWARSQRRQLQLAEELYRANFGANLDLGDHAVLAEAAGEAGLDGSEARALLESGRFVGDVRAELAGWRSKGVRSVPSIVFDDRYVISRAVSAKAFQDILEGIASEVPVDGVVWHTVAGAEA